MPIVEDLAGQPLLQMIVIALLGLIVGSFLNVVIHRLPRRMAHEWHQQCAELRGENGPAESPPGLVLPPSQCPTCGQRLKARDNIPILSFLLLRGRCRYCGSGISARYPIVEGVTALLSLVALWQLGWTAPLAAALVFTWFLVALTAIDLDHLLLPDNLTLPLLWLGLLLSLGGLFTSVESAVLGAAAGYLVLWTLYHGFRLLTGKEGMGYGDFKLLAAMGAWMGWQSLPLVIILSSGVGALVGIAMIAGLGRGRDHPIPFGPYIAAAGWLTLLWGDSLLDAYWRFAGLA